MHQLAREFSRDAMICRSIGSIGRDVRFAVLSLSRTPTFTIPVVLTLALGIGATRLLLRPLPFRDADRIMLLHENGPKSPDMDVNPSGCEQSFSGFVVALTRAPFHLHR
jgi:hypothetical protein